MAPDNTTKRGEPEVIECDAEPMDPRAAPGHAGGSAGRPSGGTGPRVRVIRANGLLGCAVVVVLLVILLKLGGALLGGLASALGNPRILFAVVVAVLVYMVWRTRIRGRV